MVTSTETAPHASARIDEAHAGARSAAARVVDPEIPVITIEDLGILRDVTVEADGHVEVTITPTYSGCPAMDEIAADVGKELAAAGFEDVSVRLVLSPAWTTDMITERGREALREYGIAPPTHRVAAGPVPVTLSRFQPQPACPQCGSARTTEISRFASTACKALHRCLDCQEPFDYFKAL
jgi:ring-1,2-phenylacetyl-CoA epoxidase subunit PaaD